MTLFAGFLAERAFAGFLVAVHALVMECGGPGRDHLVHRGGVTGCALNVFRLLERNIGANVAVGATLYACIKQVFMTIRALCVHGLFQARRVVVAFFVVAFGAVGWFRLDTGVMVTGLTVVVGIFLVTIMIEIGCRSFCVVAGTAILVVLERGLVRRNPVLVELGRVTGRTVRRCLVVFGCVVAAGAGCGPEVSMLEVGKDDLAAFVVQ